MKLVGELIGLAIDSPLVSRDKPNFLPTTWPPEGDFPVVVDKAGVVISRYRDHTWNVSVWAGKQFILNFGDGPRSSKQAKSSISPDNAALLRQIAAWWLWGPKAVRSARTLVSRFNSLRRLFVYCSRMKIRADQLIAYPAVADGLGRVLAGSVADSIITVLHDLLEHQDGLGFVLLDREGMRRLVASLPRHDKEQTPYIPPRIWLYQARRLEAFLSDFAEHREKLRACFTACLGVYAAHYGSLALACVPKSERHSTPPPFSSISPKWTEQQIAARIGSFEEIASAHGIADLIDRWLGPAGAGTVCGIRRLAAYFRMTSTVGTAYLLNFSLMRIEEAWKLHSDCLMIERDPKFGDIYLLCGETTKTERDDDARWVACSKVRTAIDAMALVSDLRLVPARSNSRVPLYDAYALNPHLVVRSYEPWANSQNQSQSLDVRPSYPSFDEFVTDSPILFDPNELRITAEDLAIARRVTPTLDPGTYAIGKAWSFGWHQLRRTGAVNMQASGLVSDPSLQYQLKHSSRAMSLYYGQGHSSLRLNDSMRSEYLRTMYEVMGKELELLFSSRFVSPHGERHKAIQLELISGRDSAALAKSARAGDVVYKETLLGGCTKRGPCEFGGVDNVVRCGGGDGKKPCGEALYDREREPEIRRLKEILLENLSDAAEGSRNHNSILAQLRAADNALEMVQ